MGLFRFDHTVTKDSEGYIVLNSYGSITVPEVQQLSSVPLIWSIGSAGSTGSTTNSGQNLWYKTNGTQSSETTITSSLDTNATYNLNLTNATTLKFMFQTYFTVGTGAGYGQKIWYCILKLPFGGISSENIITAAKFNEVAAALEQNANYSATSGNTISEEWINLAATQSIVFDNTKPLLSDLTSLLINIPADWEATGIENVGW